MQDEVKDRFETKLVPNTNWGQNYSIKDLNLPGFETASQITTVREAIKILNDKGYDQLPIVNDKEEILGITNSKLINEKLLKLRVTLDDKVSLTMDKCYRKVRKEINL